jgi:hypothetical protein
MLLIQFKFNLECVPLHDVEIESERRSESLQQSFAMESQCVNLNDVQLHTCGGAEVKRKYAHMLSMFLCYSRVSECFIGRTFHNEVSH